MRNHSFDYYSYGGNQTSLSHGFHSFLRDLRQPCRYCNEFKGSHYEFNHNQDQVKVPYCSKKCFIEDGNDLTNNEYTTYLNDWAASGELELAIVKTIEKKKSDDAYFKKQRKQTELEEQQKKIASKNIKIFITISLLVLTIAGLGYYFFLYNPYSDEQLANACDFVENSYENTGIAADNLPYEEQKKRSYCFNLFEPEDFKLLEDDLQEIYENMEKACEKSQ
jgi:hypothetical protein